MCGLPLSIGGEIWGTRSTTGKEERKKSNEIIKIVKNKIKKFDEVVPTYKFWMISDNKLQCVMCVNKD